MPVLAEEVRGLADLQTRTLEYVLHGGVWEKPTRCPLISLAARVAEAERRSWKSALQLGNTFRSMQHACVSDV